MWERKKEIEMDVFFYVYIYYILGNSLLLCTLPGSLFRVLMLVHQWTKEIKILSCNISYNIRTETRINIYTCIVVSISQPESKCWETRCSLEAWLWQSGSRRPKSRLFCRSSFLRCGSNMGVSFLELPERKIMSK